MHHVSVNIMNCFVEKVAYTRLIYIWLRYWRRLSIIINSIIFYDFTIDVQTIAYINMLKRRER
jgi:hypothetical protein